MFRQLSYAVERWPLHTPFRIARGTREAIDVVTVELREGDVTGRGEGSITARYGESVASVEAQLARIAPDLAARIDRAALRRTMPPGSARNALDCALWDLDVRLGRATLPAAPRPIATAQTIGIDTPEAMAAAARALRGAAIVKVKVDGDDPAGRLRAVHAEVPGSRLIVDANESWTIAQVTDLQPLLAELGVEFLEQPLPAAADAALEGFAARVPICADESCHVAADVARLARRYAMVNIKLDKTGGLTEALDLLAAARAHGMGVMVGCMISTSLAIAAALQVALAADCADLDGPLWLAEDRPAGVTLGEHGMLHPPAPWFWATPPRVTS